MATINVFGAYGEVWVADAISQDWALLATAAGRAWRDLASFAPTVGTDRKVSISNGAIGQSGLLARMDDGPAEAQFPSVASGSAWYVCCIKITLDPATWKATAALDVTTTGATEVAATAAVPTSTNTTKWWPLFCARVDAGISAVTLGSRFVQLKGSSFQVPPGSAQAADQAALPAGTVYVEAGAAQIKMRVNENGTTVTKDISPAGVRTRTKVFTAPPTMGATPYNAATAKLKGPSGDLSSQYTVCAATREPGSNKIWYLMYLNGYPTILNVYDPATDTCTYKSSPTYTCSTMAWNDAGTRLFICTSANATWNAAIYEKSSGTYSSVSQPSGVSAFANVYYYQGSWYCLDSLNSSGNPQTACYKLSDPGGTWTAIASRPDSNFSSSPTNGVIAAQGSKMLALNNSGQAAAVYNAATNTWTTLSVQYFFAAQANCWGSIEPGGTDLILGSYASSVIWKIGDLTNASTYTSQTMTGTPLSGASTLGLDGLYYTVNGQTAYRQPVFKQPEIQFTAAGNGVIEVMDGNVCTRSVTKNTAYSNSRIVVTQGETIALASKVPVSIGETATITTYEIGGI